jgi:hypothetical protein
VKCFCGTEARFVVNGVNKSLQYWYCDTCRDEAKTALGPVESKATTITDGSLLISNTAINWGRINYIPPTAVVVKSVTFGKSINSTYDTCSVHFGNGTQLYTFCDLMTQSARQKHPMSVGSSTYMIEVDFLKKQISYDDGPHGHRRVFTDGYKSP